MTTHETQWLAGLLEGEGCFWGYWRGPYFQPGISLAMTDRDVVARAADLFGTKVSDRSPDKRGNKPMWRCSVQSTRAARWMADLHEFMGERRRAKIESVLREWAEYSPPTRKSTSWRKHAEVTA